MATETGLGLRISWGVLSAGGPPVLVVVQDTVRMHWLHVITLSIYSTMSSCLNALSAVTWEDVLKPVMEHKISETVKTWITKVLGM